MQTAINRTFICSVVFLDIVEYSRKPVAEQIFFKERLNTLLTEALASVAPNDRIILDTGDGAALSFLGDPEDALYVTLSLREALQKPPPPGPDLKIRLGINLGPVRLVKDINGQPNIIGDGINVAQRIMSFSEPGQILVSRSYHEGVSRLSEDFSRLFHFEGSRTDKHVREHEVYAVEAAGEALKRVTAIPRKKDASPSSPAVFDKLSRSASF
ncbi:MAG: adenylate/guanylate cyclase domain-containing protein, partial [Burkholderiales bacterium]